MATDERGMNLKEIIDLSPPIMIDDQGVFWGNKAFCKVLDIPRNFSKKDFFEKIGNENTEKLGDLFGNQGEESAEYRFQVVNGDENKCFAIARKSAGNGQSFSVYSLRDAKSEEKLEKALQMIKVMKKQLEEKEKSERMVARAAPLAHDLNNILWIIQGHSDLASGDIKEIIDELKEEEDGIVSQKVNRKLYQIADSIGNIAESSQRAGNLISRISNPSMKSVAEEFLIDTFISKFSWPRMWPVEIKTEASDCTVKIDKHDFARVIINLVKNGSEAMGSKEPVQISTKKTLTHVIIGVRDQGKGVPNNIKSKIFEIGFSTKGSTGIGLASCKTIIEDNGGHILCTNAEEGGAVFRVLLPLVKQ